MTRQRRLACAFGLLAMLSSAALAQQETQTMPVNTSSAASPVAPASPAKPAATARVAASSSKPTSSSATPSGSSVSNSAGPVKDNGALLVEGEKRFATNCGRCHQSPHHFPPRMMATVVRHMRVRATITDEDMRLILRYLTQ